jgi:hypothetical protein
MKQVPLENLTPRQRRFPRLGVGLEWCALAVVGSAARLSRLRHVAQHISVQPVRHVARS